LFVTSCAAASLTGDLRFAIAHCATADCDKHKVCAAFGEKERCKSSSEGGVFCGMYVEKTLTKPYACSVSRLLFRLLYSELCMGISVSTAAQSKEDLLGRRKIRCKSTSR